MKNIIVTSLLSIISCLVLGQTKKDSLAINETALNYIEGFYTNDHKRVEKAISSELVKRIIIKDTLGNFILKNMGSSELIYNTKKFKKSKDQSSEDFKAIVTIFEISNDIATIKINQNKMPFFDYLQLAKINDSWKIINVLWARTE